MTSIVALGLVGALCTLVVIFEMLRRKRLREKYAVIWVLVATGTLLIALAPGLLTQASEVVGVQLPVNLLFFLASMVLLFLSIQYSYEIGRLEDRTRTLAEEIALLRLEVQRLRDDADKPSAQGRPDDGSARGSTDGSTRRSTHGDATGHLDEGSPRYSRNDQ